MTTEFPKTGLVRLSAILAPKGPLPISRSSWHNGVREGRFPRGIKIGPRTVCYRAEDVNRIVSGEYWKEEQDA